MSHGELRGPPGPEWWLPRLWHAFMHIWSEKRAQDLLHIAGVDGISICDFCGRAEERLADLAGELGRSAWARGPLKLAEQPKEDGTMRPVWVPNTRDRIVARAVLEWLEPRVSPHLEDSCVGSRAGFGVLSALRILQGGLDKGHTLFVRTDIASFFDTVPRDAAFGALRATAGRSLLCDLAEALTRCPSSDSRGVAQGIAVSPLIANLYLSPVDRHFRGRCYVRYVDDIALVCGSSRAASRALQRLGASAASVGLTLNSRPDKTYLRRTVGDTAPAFLGFEFVGGRIRVPPPVVAGLRQQTAIAERLEMSCPRRAACVARSALARAGYYSVLADPAIAQVTERLRRLPACL